MKPINWKARMIETLRHGPHRRRAESLPGPVILMYHGVLNQIADAELDRWDVTRRAFIRHLDYLLSHYRVVSLEQALQGVAASNRDCSNWVVLTFDDALASVYQVVRPLLRERDLPYMVAVPAGLIDSGRT